MKGTIEFSLTIKEIVAVLIIAALFLFLGFRISQIADRAKVNSQNIQLIDQFLTNQNKARQQQQSQAPSTKDIVDALEKNPEIKVEEIKLPKNRC